MPRVSTPQNVCKNSLASSIFLAEGTKIVILFVTFLFGTQAHSFGHRDDGLMSDLSEVLTPEMYIHFTFVFHG